MIVLHLRRSLGRYRPPRIRHSAESSSALLRGLRGYELLGALTYPDIRMLLPPPASEKPAEAE